MKRKMLWKDIGRCFSRSKGRFFSICALVALGCFALVGLQVAGPDMGWMNPIRLPLRRRAAGWSSAI